MDRLHLNPHPPKRSPSRIPRQLSPNWARPQNRPGPLAHRTLLSLYNRQARPALPRRDPPRSMAPVRRRSSNRSQHHEPRGRHRAPRHPATSAFRKSNPSSHLAPQASRLAPRHTSPVHRHANRPRPTRPGPTTLLHPLNPFSQRRMRRQILERCLKPALLTTL